MVGKGGRSAMVLWVVVWCGEVAFSDMDACTYVFSDNM